MVQQKITDYFTDLRMNYSEEVPSPRNIMINGNLHGSRSLLDNKMLYLESEYEPVMVTYEDSSMFVLCCLNMKSGEEVMVHYYQNFCKNRDTVWKIIREIQTAKYLDHPNILEFESIGLPIIANTEEESCLKVAGRLFDDCYLVYKSAGFENLQNFLSTGQSIFNIPKMVYQVLNTLKYLHDSVGILHHGLSLRDIYVSTINQNIKLSGFSSSHLIGEDSSFYPKKQLCQLAPEELLMCDEFTTSPSVDVWYLGCLVTELITRQSPFTVHDSAVQASMEHQLEHVLAVLKPEYSEFSFIRCGRCRGNLLAKYEESSKNSNPSNPTFLDAVRHSCPWAVGLLTKMLCFDPTKRISIELAIEYVRTNQGIAEEDSEDKFNEYMEEEGAANTNEVMEEEGAANTSEVMEEEGAANTSEVMEDEDYLKMSEFGLCDEQQLREIIWTEVTKFHQRLY